MGAAAGGAWGGLFWKQAPLAPGMPAAWALLALCPWQVMSWLLTCSSSLSPPFAWLVRRVSYAADGRWRLYYHGLSSVGGSASGVGLALTDKEDLAEFEGVRCAF